MRTEMLALAALTTGCVGLDSSAGSDASHAECEEPPASCFEAWACPTVAASAPARPDPAEFPAIRLDVHYEASATEARIELVDIQGAQVARPSDGPFSPDTHTGSWVELRDDSGSILFTRGFHALIPESREVPPGSEEEPPTQVVICPEEGVLTLHGLPNDPAATEVVLFQEPIDGEPTFETVELARFRLPAIGR